jgi:hypothetical protein
MAVVGITTTHAPVSLATPHVISDFTAIAIEPGVEGEFRLLFASRGRPGRAHFFSAKA